MNELVERVRPMLRGSGYAVRAEEVENFTGYVVPFLVERSPGAPRGALAVRVFTLWRYRGVLWYDEASSAWRVAGREREFERLGEAIFHLSCMGSTRPRRRRAPYS